MRNKILFLPVQAWSDFAVLVTDRHSNSSSWRDYKSLVKCINASVRRFYILLCSARENISHSFPIAEKLVNLLTAGAYGER